MFEGKIIAVDFDGTLCENRWPKIGVANLKLIERLKYEQTRGVKLILWTCRDGKELENAVSWCAAQGLHFDAVNDNLPEVIEQFGGNPRKIHADYYIDDKAAPLSFSNIPKKRPRREVMERYRKITEERNKQIKGE